MGKLLLAIFLFLANISLFGQTSYPINYSKTTTLRINSETTIGKDNFYDVDFLNTKNQVIKSIQKMAEEDHSAKNGYASRQAITYHFYTDTLENYSISIDQTGRILFKTVYTYSHGKQTGWETYSVRPKITKESFQAFSDKDLFLNYPGKFPTTNLTLETKMVRKFENENLVYKCYYERYGNLKKALPARDHFFKYNAKGQLIELISNPKSAVGGTAFLRQTFEYNDKNELVKREWYEDKRHQDTDEFEYGNATINQRRLFYDAKGKPENSSATIIVYTLDSDGSYYSNNTFKTKFIICTDLE